MMNRKKLFLALTFLFLSTTAVASNMPVKIDYNYVAGNIKYIKLKGENYFDLLSLGHILSWPMYSDVLNDFLVIKVKGHTIKINTRNGHIIGLAGLKKVDTAYQQGRLFIEPVFFKALNNIIDGYIYAGRESVFVLTKKPNITLFQERKGDNNELTFIIHFDQNLKYKVKEAKEMLIFDFPNGVLAPTIAEYSSKYLNITFQQSISNLRLKILQLFNGSVKKVDYLPGQILIRYIIKGQKTIRTRPHKIYKIVIDAGHGGEDPGAIGYKGLKEKDIVLDIAKKLKRKLAALSNVQVIMTRSSDYYIPLSRRTEIANKERADMFISIHCNAAPSYKANTASGVEVYFVSEAKDKHSKEVEARENKEIIGSTDYLEKTQQSILERLLNFSLVYKQHLFLSSRLALAIKDALTRENDVENRGVKNAMFYVLRGADMPSVLLEVGFITNPAEAKKLSTSAYRERVANAIFKGIKNYISSYEEKVEK